MEQNTQKAITFKSGIKKMRGQFTGDQKIAGMNSRKVIYSAVIKKPEGAAQPRAVSVALLSPLWCDLDFCSQLSFGRVAVRT